jgi:hypothetical protein
VKTRIGLVVVAALVAAAPVARADDDMTGRLLVPAQLDIVNDKGKLVPLTAGEYWVNLDMDGSPGKQEMKINFKDTKGKKRKAVLKVPADQTLPKEGGEVTLEGSRNGQAFDLTLKVAFSYTDGPQLHGTEDCNCHSSTYCEWNDPNDCETIEVCGSQWIVYHYRTHLQAGEATFSTSSAPATWKGSRTWDEFIYDKQGPCSL